MLVRHPLWEIFGGTRALLLEQLLEVATPQTGRAIARAAGVSPTTASTGLQELVARGIVAVTTTGSASTFRINRPHRSVPMLERAMATARRADRDFVARLMRMLPKKPVGIYVFGSIARGEDGPESDVDVLVVASTKRDATRWRADAHLMGQQLTSWLGKQVSVQISTPPTRAEARKAFWREIKRDALRLAGLPVRDLVRS